MRTLIAATAAAALLAAAGAATPAAAAATAPRAACSVHAAMDRDEHTGQLFATGYTDCPVRGPAGMNVTLWVDDSVAKQTYQPCAYGSDCATSAGSVSPLPGRHRYCSRAAFDWAGTSPTQVQWSCEYLG